MGGGLGLTEAVVYRRWAPAGLVNRRAPSLVRRPGKAHMHGTCGNKSVLCSLPIASRTAYALRGRVVPAASPCCSGLGIKAGAPNAKQMCRGHRMPRGTQFELLANQVLAVGKSWEGSDHCEALDLGRL